MKKIIYAIVIALAVGIISTFVFEESKYAYLLGIVSFLLTLWTNEGLALGIVSLFPIILFPAFDIQPLKQVAANYSNPVIFLFIGGFLVAIGMQKVDLHKLFAYKLISFLPKNPTGVIYSLTISSALLSAILSNTTTTLMLIPISAFLTNNTKLQQRFLLAIAYGASIGGVITPIGTPPNLIYFGLADEYGFAKMPFSEWVLKLLPIAVIMLSIAPQILLVGIRKESVKIWEKKERLGSAQYKFLAIFITLCLLLFLKTPIKQTFPMLHWLDDKTILLFFGLTLFFPKINILNWKEDFKKIPYEIIFLFGAGFAVGEAFSSTGLALELTSYFKVFTGLPNFLLILSIVSIVSFSTQVTSNTAFTAISLPILYAFSQLHGLNSEIILMVATIASSYAFMLPIATPPNAIVFSGGVVKIKQMVGFGFFINILGIIVVSLVAYFFWGLF